MITEEVAILANITYRQPEKNMVRQNALQYAVETLTVNRSSSCCVEKEYVRNIYRVLSIEPSIELKTELQKINPDYFVHWERLHSSCIGSKKASDLVVCYLSGPEPQNDFNVLTSLGILPQNIWAFEYDKDMYRKALNDCTSGAYPQPRLIKQPIEAFFRDTPRKFDIVYLDACGTVPSSQHALRCVASMSKYHRLASPGILITNFACPSREEQEYVDCVTEYLFFKYYPNVKIQQWEALSHNDKYCELRDKVYRDFYRYYGDFITACLCDICAVIMPAQRFVNSKCFSTIINGSVNLPIPSSDHINDMVNCSLGRASTLVELIPSEKRNRLTSALWTEFSGDNPFRDDAASSLRKLFFLKQNPDLLRDEVKEIYNKTTDPTVFYQFLDRPFGGMYLDFIINQLAYPMHAKTSGIKRFRYCAKETEMFTDVIPLDECRYIYDWLPGMHQVKLAYEDNSWQDVFRFALDGLVKQRLKYNNEFFFRGSVIDKYEDGFEEKTLDERKVIERRCDHEST